MLRQSEVYVCNEILEKLKTPCRWTFHRLLSILCGLTWLHELSKNWLSLASSSAVKNYVRTDDSDRTGELRDQHPSKHPCWQMRVVCLCVCLRVVCLLCAWDWNWMTARLSLQSHFAALERRRRWMSLGTFPWWRQFGNSHRCWMPNFIDQSSAFVSILPGKNVNKSLPVWRLWGILFWNGKIV